MANLWCLFIVELILLACFFSLSKQDIMAPSVFMCLVFVFSTFIAILNGNNWNINYEFKSFVLISTGIFCFGITDIVIQNIFHKRKRKELSENIYAIYISKWKVIFVTIVNIAVLYLVYQEVKRIGGTASWAEGNIFYAYRIITSHSTDLTDSQYMSGVVNQLMKIVIVSGFIFLFIFINNVIVCKKKLRENFIYLISPILLCMMTLITGVRTNILRLFIFGLVCGYILVQYKRNWSIKTSWKFGYVLFMALIIILSLFSLSQVLLGRSGSTIAKDVISNYAGASIQHFNQYIQEPPAKNIVFGQETLNGVWSFLYKLGISNEVYTAHSEYRYLNSSNFGNVYTFFRRFLQDFGVIGMYLMTIISSTVISLIYNRTIKYRKMTYNRMLIIIEYGYLFYIVAMSSIDNFVHDYLNIGTLIMVVILHVMIWFFLKLKIKVRYNIKGVV